MDEEGIRRFVGKTSFVTNAFLSFFVFAFLVGGIDSGCGPEFKGKCNCGRISYQDEMRYVVNCTDEGFSDASVLEFLPEEVEVLIFTGNIIPELPWNVFGTTKNYSRLKIIDMSNNRIKEIFGKSYHRVSNVERLVLNHNEISISEGRDYNHHHPRVFSNFERLRELHLTDAFADKSENLASDLHDIFVNSNLTKLIKLHLEQNQIFAFEDKKVFCELPSIMDLYLGDNFLTGLDFEISCLKHLRYIDLENNRINTLSEKELEVLDSLPARNQSLTVDLHDNPFSCECGIKDLFLWLSRTKVEVRRKELLKCYRESSEEKRERECPSDKGLPPAKHSKTPGTPAQYRATEILLGLLLVVLVFMLLGLIYANRKALRYKINPILESVSRKVHYTSINHYEDQEVDV